MWKYAVTSLAALATATAAAAGAVPPSAEDAVVEVAIGDLDLATVSGQARLQRRLRSAAGSICGVVPVAPLQFKVQAQACVESVLATSRDQVARATARAEDKVRLARR